MRHRVYLAASTQAENIGVLQYGTEQDRMQLLADRIGYWLITQKKFTIFRNKPGWSLKQTVDDCNNLACHLFVDNHSNAGHSAADGAEIYYASTRGKIVADAVYNRLQHATKSVDNGVRPDTFLYANGLYVLRNTIPTSILIEHFYHTNKVDVEHYLNSIDDHAIIVAKGICDAFEVKWYEPTGISRLSIEAIVDSLVANKVTTNKTYWLDVLHDKRTASSRQLQLVLGRLLKLI